MRRTLLVLTMLAATGAALAAGQVDVSFKAVDQLRDVGHRSFDGERNVKLLADHFKSLGRRLPDGQVLTVEVLDVDMAGELKPMRQGNDIRVMKGAADWPMLSLRWTLKSADRTLDSREERISDMSYLAHPLRGNTDPLAYESRMIDRWFDERFGPKAVASTR